MVSSRPSSAAQEGLSPPHLPPLCKTLAPIRAIVLQYLCPSSQTRLLYYICSRSTRPPVSSTIMSVVKGQVKWFIASKDYGFTAPTDASEYQEFFVHHTEIIGASFTDTPPLSIQRLGEMPQDGYLLMGHDRWKVSECWRRIRMLSSKSEWTKAHQWL